MIVSPCPCDPETTFIGGHLHPLFKHQHAFSFLGGEFCSYTREGLNEEVKNPHTVIIICTCSHGLKLSLKELEEQLK